MVFASFVAFFPQLIAGPIERAQSLLTQLQKPTKIKVPIVDNGINLILWGIFKKVVIADSLGRTVDLIFDNTGKYNGGVLLLGAIYFSIQIYCDFSGYSNIAKGSASLLGIKLQTNFNFPYFSSNISDFLEKMAHIIN